MTLAAGLAAIVLALLALLALLAFLARRRAAAEPTTATPDLAPDGEVPKDQPEQEAEVGDPALVRVLRAQVRTLEQALEEAEAATVTVRHEAAEQAQGHATVEAASQVVEVQAVGVPAVAADVVHPSPVVPVPAMPDLGVSTLEALPPDDVVLPVPALPLPHDPRASRWFRRRAA